MKRRYPDRTVKERKKRWYAAEMERLRERFGGECGECGITHGALRYLQNGNVLVMTLEFAHVEATGLKGRGRGRTKRIHDIRRNPEAYRLLCRQCHMDLDFNGHDRWNPQASKPELEVPF
ncbi:MAG: hypothetical protein ACREI9_04670 [Nitrospiraceae bacterium]